MTDSGRLLVFALPVVAAALLVAIAVSGGLLPVPWRARVEKALNLFILAAIGVVTVWRAALAVEERSFNSAVSALFFGAVLTAAVSRTMRRGWWGASRPATLEKETA